MIPKILRGLQEGGSYQPRYPTKSKQMEWQLSGQQSLNGLIYVILNVLGTDGFQDALNIVKKLFFFKEREENVPK
jgi:hypothetical protein